MYSLLILSGSSTVTTTASGVPAGGRSGEEDMSREPSHMRSKTAHAIVAPNWSCFRRIGDDLNARSYGGGWEDLRGGRAKCIFAAAVSPFFFFGKNAPLDARLSLWESRRQSGQEKTEILTLWFGLCNNSALNGVSRNVFYHSPTKCTLSKILNQARENWYH